MQRITQLAASVELLESSNERQKPIALSRESSDNEKVPSSIDMLGTLFLADRRMSDSARVVRERKCSLDVDGSISRWLFNRSDMNRTSW